MYRVEIDYVQFAFVNLLIALLQPDAEVPWIDRGSIILVFFSQPDREKSVCRAYTESVCNSNICVITAAAINMRP